MSKERRREGEVLNINKLSVGQIYSSHWILQEVLQERKILFITYAPEIPELSNARYFSVTGLGKPFIEYLINHVSCKVLDTEKINKSLLLSSSQYNRGKRSIYNHYMK